MAFEILIVDDEPDIRLLVDAILRDEGYETRQAGTSDAAIAAFRERMPSLVILDVWLQGSKLDGLGILKVFQAEEPAVPVVMMSGHGNIETAVTAIQHGAYDFIEKPFQSDRLLLIVKRALEAARLARENAELRLRAGPETALIGESSASRQGCSHRLTRADRRACGGGQGGGRADDPRPLAPRRWSVRDAELRHPQPKPVRGGTVWRRECGGRQWSAASRRGA